VTPFSFKTKVVDTDSKQPVGFLLVRGREDGSWSVNLHHWEKASAGCDTPDACFPAAQLVLAEWWLETERRHKDGLEVIMSWPEYRPGHRPGWKDRELSKATRAHRWAAAAVLQVQKNIKETMLKAGWPAESASESS
jgi:hypothetical protein